MHRIRSPKYEGKKLPAIMIQHGLLANSESFILNGEESAAFKYAKAGYDIWLGNNRGTTYSRKHKILDVDLKNDQATFFDYSFYELGKYDVPAQVNFVIN